MLSQRRAGPVLDCHGELQAACLAFAVSVPSAAPGAVGLQERTLEDTHQPNASLLSLCDSEQVPLVSSKEKLGRMK